MDQVNICNTIFQQHKKSQVIMHDGVSERCWHCHHGFNSEPIFIPMNEEERHGCFCSLECAKTYIYSLKRFDENLLLIRLADTYRAEEIRCAPPFQFLKVYGGHLTIEEFRTQGGVVNPLPVTKPYIPYQMGMEVTTTTKASQSESVALYDEFLARQNTSIPREKPQNNGTLMKFLKK